MPIRHPNAADQLREVPGSGAGEIVVYLLGLQKWRWQVEWANGPLNFTEQRYDPKKLIADGVLIQQINMAFRISQLAILLSPERGETWTQSKAITR